MNKLKITYNINSKEYVCQFLQGCYGIKDLINIEYNRDEDTNFGHVDYIKIEYQNKNILIDLNDRDNSYDNKDVYKQYDLIFKRSLELEASHKENVLPYGFNYFVATAKNDFYKLNNRCSYKGSIKKILLLLGFNVGQQKLLGPNTLNYIETKKEYDVLFLTRLWFPYTNYKNLDEIKKVIKINSVLRKTYEGDLERINVIEYIRAKYQNSICGISKTPNLLEKHTNLIIEQKYTNRKSFIEFARRSKVCITTNGLWDSIGWKFGEFIAIGAVILAERLKHITPDDFKENVNYIEYKDKNDFEYKLSELLKNHKLRYELSNNNILYYKRKLEPKALVLNMLTTIRNISDDT